MENLKTIEDYKKLLECINMGMSSNFEWCLDCNHYDCIVYTSEILNKRY